LGFLIALSHLFIIDDCLLFTKAKASQIWLVYGVLETFYKALGMKTNVHKFNFLPSKKLARSIVKKFEGMINFNHTLSIGKYLVFDYIPTWLPIQNFPI